LGRLHIETLILPRTAGPRALIENRKTGGNAILDLERKRRDMARMISDEEIRKEN
jgi:hypothetical protein